MTRRNVCVLGMLLAGLMACSEEEDQSKTTFHLDRPTSLAFGCYGGLRLLGEDGVAQPTDATTVSAMPAAACEVRARPEPQVGTDLPNVPTGQEDLSEQGGPELASVDFYALILQRAPGTIALARLPAKPSSSYLPGEVAVIDSESATPGKSAVAVGAEPVAIAVDDSGCYALTVNEGSCDATEVGINSMLDFQAGAAVVRVDIQNAAGTVVAAKPADMVAFSRDATLGVECPANPQGTLYIAYPDCHAVGVYDVATRKLVASIQFAADGTATLGDGNLVCPRQCGVPEAVTPGARPVTLDIVRDKRVSTQRLVVGLGNRSTLAVAELGAGGVPTAVKNVGLEGNVGVVDVALSPVIGMGGDSGVITDSASPGGEFQFVYGIATDGTVRVADVLDVNHECETQADPRALAGLTDIRALSCLQSGILPRRAGAISPGLHLPGDAAPRSVDIARIDPDRGVDTAPEPGRLIGYFAFVAATTGSTYIVNIDDDNAIDLPSAERPLTGQWPLVLAHQLRDRTPLRDLLSLDVDNEPVCNTSGPSPNVSAVDTFGGARLAAEPQQTLSSSNIDLGKGYALPRLRGLLCEGADGERAISELSFAAPEEVRASAYPDFAALARDETWTLTYEGALSGDGVLSAIDGPAVRRGFMQIKAGMFMIEPGAPYCQVGVEQFDTVVMLGCDPKFGNRQCSTGEVCYVHPEAEVSTGMCIAEGEVGLLAEPCREFFTSLRRYGVTEVSPGRLRLIPRRHILRTTPVDGCASDEQCQELALVDAEFRAAGHPSQETPTAEHSYVCEPDPSRARSAEIRRCVMSCETSEDCEAGSVCDGGRCVEGVVPPLQCATTVQRYEVRASDAFTLIGSQTGYQHPWQLDGAGTSCVATGDPRLVGRIPLRAPACGDDPALAPNPCSQRVSHTQTQPNYDPATCIASESPLTVLETDAIWVRTPQFSFHMVDPTYPGDVACRGDRGGTLSIPLAYPGYSVSFRQVGGAFPYALDAQAVIPSGLVVGPAESIWVLDEGDLVTTELSLRGRVLRFDGNDLASVISLR